MTRGKAVTTTVWSRAVENTAKHRTARTTGWDEPSRMSDERTPPTARRSGRKLNVNGDVDVLDGDETGRPWVVSRVRIWPSSRTCRKTSCSGSIHRVRLTG